MRFNSIRKPAAYVILVGLAIFARTAQAQKPEPMRITLSESARLRLTETVVSHRLDLTVTDVMCDSSLTAAQCATSIDEASDAGAKFQAISLTNLDEAMHAIDQALKSIVSKKEDEALWSLLRSLAVQARTVVSEKARSFTQSTRKMPSTVSELYRERGIARIEFRNRMIITANRMILQTSVVDVAKATDATHPDAGILLPTVSRDLVDATQSLDSALDRAMQDLSARVTQKVAP